MHSYPRKGMSPPKPLRAYPGGLLLLLSLVAFPVYAQSGNNVAPHLQAIQQLSDQALAASRAAEQGRTVADVKARADAVFETVWGIRSGLIDAAPGAADVHGWKTRWQVDNTAFDEAFVERNGTVPPEITDITQLGIVGRGLYVRSQLQALLDADDTPDGRKRHTEHTIAALNNVIGWMQMDDGVTKAERQPRVDLTRLWDAPSDFWLSSSDTGWLYEVYAQALNIMKTDYAGDVAMAHRHAAAMTQLIEKYRTGMDVDDDGTVEPVMMEGGLDTALQHARLAGLIAP